MGKLLWYWSTPCANCSMNIKRGLSENQVYHKIQESYLELLKDLRKENKPFGLIQESLLFRGDEKLISPKDWNGEKDVEYEVGKKYANRVDRGGFIFYENMILEEFPRKGILLPPTIFLVSDLAHCSPVQEMEEISNEWARISGTRKPKVAFLDEATKFNKILEQIKRFED